MVVLDYQLPDGNGLDLLRDITSKPEHPQVVMVTGQGAEEVAAEAFRLNASGYVVKDARMADMLPQVVANSLSEVSLNLAQEQLKRIERNQRALLDATPETLMLIDLDGTILTINNTGAARFGRTIDDMIGTNLADYFSRELSESRREQMVKVIKSLEPIKFEDSRGDMTLSNVIYPVFDVKGKVRRVALFSQDITEQKRAAEALQRSREELEVRVAERTTQLRAANADLRDEIEERKRVEQSLTALSVRFEEQARVLDQILSSSTQQFYLYDAKGKFIYASRAAADMLGRSQQEIEGKYWWELGMPEESMRPIELQREQVMSGGEPASGTTELPGRKGTRYFEYTLSPIKRANGTVDTVVGTARDITQERATALDLAKFSAKQEEQAQLLDLTNETIVVRDMDSRVIFWNAGAEKMFGWVRDEAIGRDWRELLSVELPEDPEDYEDELLTEGRWEGRLRVKDRQGNAMTVESRQVVRFDEARQPNAVLEIEYDLAERVEAERGLREGMRDLEERVKVFEAIPMAIIVHDMENKISFWGRGAEERFGWTADEALGKNVLELLDAKLPEDPDEIEYDLLNESRWDGLIIYTDRDGRSKAMSAHWYLEWRKGKPDKIFQLLS